MSDIGRTGQQKAMLSHQFGKNASEIVEEQQQQQLLTIQMQQNVCSAWAHLRKFRQFRYI